MQAETSSHQSLFPAVLTGSEPLEKSSQRNHPATRSPLTLFSHTPDPAPSISGPKPGFSGIFLNFLAFFSSSFKPWARGQDAGLPLGGAGALLLIFPPQSKLQ